MCLHQKGSVLLGGGSAGGMALVGGFFLNVLLLEAFGFVCLFFSLFFVLNISCSGYFTYSMAYLVY